MGAPARIGSQQITTSCLLAAAAAAWPVSHPVSQFWNHDMEASFTPTSCSSA
jgi:hypothetical protein